ncbi:MAG: ThuA domain-containing protein [Pricia sp.]
MMKKLLRNVTIIAMGLFSLAVTGQQIASFTLVNAENDADIKTLTNGETINFDDSGTSQLSIRANTSGAIGSIIFSLDGATVQTESNAPYALLGNAGSDYAPWTPQPKTYTISGTAYADAGGKGALLDTYSIRVTFTDGTAVDPVGPVIQSLILVNADSDEDISEITTGSVFDLNEIGTANLNIRAETGAGTESVIFDYQGVLNYRTENLPVYAIGGNTGDNYAAWNPDLGLNTLTVTAYSEDKGSGVKGASVTVDFEIIEGGADNELPAVIRLNSGGETLTFGDATFVDDDYFFGDGKSYANTKINDIKETDQDALYKTERSTNGNLGTFSYAIPITNGNYDLNLHFAEIYWGATGGGSGGTGKRVFNVSIEGENVLTEFDMNAETEAMTAIVKSFSTQVSDGELNIVFGASVNQPKVSAIEVFGEGSIVDAPNDCAWNELANSSLSKVEAQSVKVNDKLYVLAGFLSGLKITPATEVYDPATNTWSTAAPMPTAVTHMGAVGVGDEIWIVAGFAGNHPGVATDKVQIYNTVTDTWSAGPPLPNPRGSGAAVYNNGKIHFFGGLLPDRSTDVGEHYILDVNDITSGWRAAASMPNPRNHLSGAAVNGKIYAIGGQYGHDAGVQDQNFLDEYDPATDSWTRKAGLPSARSHFEPGTMVHNDKIIIVGGRRGGFFFDDVTEYDPISNSWSERCELPSNLLAPSAKVFGDKLIVANGGENGTCCPKNNTISIPIEPEVVIESGLSVLVYYETGGFTHGSIPSGINMVTEFGNDLDWTVDDSETSDVFNTDNLSNYDVVIWMNTSGDGLLTASEQSAFEDFIKNGGGFVGVHAATDTYRDGSWPWYNDLVGGIVQVRPNHTANNTNATMNVVGEHPAVEHLDATWNKNEEYYYWERNGGYLYDGNINLLNVQSTGVNSYDAPRPVTWYKNYDGGRSFYTALGHNNSDYTSNENFRTMMRQAILWAGEKGGLTTAKARSRTEDVQMVGNNINFYPNPVTDQLFIGADALSKIDNGEVIIYGMDGNLIRRKVISEANHQVNVGDLPSGYYMVSLKGNEVNEEQLIFVK